MPGAVSPEITHLPTSPSAHHRRASLKILSRNIDKVALGNLVFPTWYYSPYPDSIIHDHDTNTTTVKSESVNYDGKDTKTFAQGSSGTNGIVKHAVTGAHSHTSIPHERVFLDMLHVCPYCFRYTASQSDFAGHLALHVKTEAEYYHTPANSGRRNTNTRRRRSTSTTSDDGDDDDDDDDDAPKPVPDSAIKVYSHAGYTVWDVDGEVEKLYCQNLSLFGKLFLEQKSVFFDTAGFRYFVLTYCPPDCADDVDADRPKVAGRGGKGSRGSASPTSTRKRKPDSLLAENVAPTLDEPSFPLRHQVLGFFSKENLSWDSNNLACILVFPPYQHRNLGQLLMAISYKLSGWEWEDSIIGGPEKPLSSMGRKSYLRFWSERIARFIMGQSQDAEGLEVFEEGVMEESEDGTQSMTSKKRKRKHGKGLLRDEFTVKELGDRTGMLGEDVIAALTEMGVCDVVPPKRKKQQKILDAMAGNGQAGSQASVALHDDHEVLTVIVNRSKVLDWAKRHGVDLMSSVKEEGFLGEWALSEQGSEEDVTCDTETGSEEGSEGGVKTD